MAKVIKADLIGKGLGFGIVVSRFNELVTSRLLDGCLDALARHGVAEGEITVYWVPGSFELPYLASRLADEKRHDAIICLGAVIRGSTPHHGYIAAEVTKGIAAISLKTGVPVIYGVLTTDNLEQALERAGSKQYNKGADAALSAIEMANLYKLVGRKAK
jgi:6,7-dimethyl-8-ribityllumazine synthase